MKQKFYFLCGHFLRRNFIYGIKCADTHWHYFEDLDSLSSSHGSLPAVMDSLIGTLKSVTTIQVLLDEEQAKTYYVDGKFVFKNQELKTRLGIIAREASNEKSKTKSSHELVFVSGQTNPLLFINLFEKCKDLKTDKDRMFKIRNFVDASHRVEFNELYYTGDWRSVRSAFIKKYSSSFTSNKKKEMNIEFGEEESLRSFVERKLKTLSLFTTLPFINQIEIVLADLPNPVSNLFLVNEMMTRNKTNILEFCDSIHDLVQNMREKEHEKERENVGNEPDTINNPLNRMEVFIFDSESEVESNHLMPSTSGTVNSRALIPEKLLFAVDSSELDGTSQSSECETMSVDSSSEGSRVKRRGGRVSLGRIAKRGRGRPRKSLLTIPE